MKKKKEEKTEKEKEKEIQLKDEEEKYEEEKDEDEKDNEEIKSDNENCSKRSKCSQEESDETISDHEFNMKEEDQKIDEFSKEQEEKEQEVEMTLLDIKRKVQTEYDTQKEDTKQKKFRILNYSYRDSFAGKSEKDFFVYFCFLCGYNCLISEVDIKTLPKRKTDNSIIFPLQKILHKKNDKIHRDRILIKRGEKGVETQYRMLCKECNVPIGYITNLKIDNMFIYYYDYALLNDETKCHIFKYI